MNDLAFEIELSESLSSEAQSALTDALQGVRFGSLAIPWCELVRRAHPNALSLRYLTIRREGRDAGLGILYIIHRMDLAPFISPRLGTVTRWLGRIGLHPLAFDLGFLEIPLMNLPGVLLTPEFEPMRDTITAEMLRVLRKRLDMSALCVKCEPHTVGPETLAQRPLRIPYLDNAMLTLEYADYEGYLAQFRSPRRRVMRKTRRRFFRQGGQFEVHERVGEFAPELHRLFQSTSARAEAKGMLPMPFEISREFFEGLDSLGDGKLHLTLVRVDGELASFIFTLHDGASREVKYYGADYERSLAVQAYFNLACYEIELAIEAGCDLLHMGTTSKEHKERLGGSFQPMEYLGELYHPVLRPIGNLIAKRLSSADARASDGGDNGADE
ncbi:GNAT family N-acetyltransferase [Haliangium ochraceum]|uniref:BioF2-like acetyltransferase domain-containing protein n=1 Tax=Haliangium ochraceum (strain DSM 14365 / JCM 11303 / SMP-2) TaxID=502025 RepID=D0LLE1_HALO1|nr:GNAT family N-acetyltransferase [Haliangium ochraceum]ACY18637.1 hypothetical protein Hoch_6162 [Haliangium ochraceum DSM 14365]